ncbi:MAG: ParB N-terminal domain-containing protein [Porphyromonas sp.]|nr:ParB N-terminal domain-containing protein [Porphyromonas sp.]
MKIIEMSIEDVIPYKNNPRRNDDAVKPVMESLKEFGWKQPIVIDKDNVIVCGHTRLRAAKRLKMKTVPCVMADDLTPEQIKAFRLADNKTAEFASWDIDMLNSELLDINGIDMGGFGFDLPDPEPEEDAFDVSAALGNARANPVTAVGTLYKLGNHRLLCGNSTNRADVERLLGGANG